MQTRPQKVRGKLSAWNTRVWFVWEPAATRTLDVSQSGHTHTHTHSFYVMISTCTLLHFRDWSWAASNSVKVMNHSTATLSPGVQFRLVHTCVPASCMHTCRKVRPSRRTVRATVAGKCLFNWSRRQTALTLWHHHSLFVRSAASLGDISAVFSFFFHNLPR